jgi:predicted RNA-binding protein
MSDNKCKYFIGVVSKKHVDIGVKEGFGQACHGKIAPMKRMKKGDWIIFYSSKAELGKPEKYQKFTAIGKVKDDNIYTVEFEDFEPYRRDIDYYECEEIEITSLLEHLSFIPNKKQWGFPFRFGFLEIPEEDFMLIAEKMLKNCKEVFNKVNEL